jgi:ubiquilin
MSEFTVIIKMTGDAKHPLTVTPSTTVLQLKEKIASELDVSVDRQRLIFSGKVLKNDDTLETYKIKEGHSIHLVKGAAKAAASNGANGVADANTASSGSPASGNGASTPSVPHIETGQGAFNPLAGLTDARYAGYNIPMPSMDQLGFGADGMQLPAENQMEQMMENPMFQESMRSMLSNPQMLDYMIQQSPQLRAMGPAAREMLQSDYVKNLLTNPQAMRSMMELQRAMGGAGNGLGFGTDAATAFPTPGNPNATSTDGSAGGAGGANDASGAGSAATAAAAAANPFASLFGSGAAGAGAGSATGAGTAGAGAFPNLGGFGANPFLNPNLMSLFGGAGAGAGASTGATPPPVDTRPPEEVYATQLRQLNDMGFFDFDRNITALRRSGGSVEGAIEMLFNGSV